MYLTSAYKSNPFGKSKVSLRDTVITKPDGSKISLAPGHTTAGMSVAEYTERKRMEKEHFYATHVDAVRLPELDLVKTHTSTFIGRNPNKNLKAYDF
jgi:hypothetical protein